MLARQPQRMYLTHYGCIGNVAALGRELLDQLEAVVALGERTRPQALVPTERHAALTAGLTTVYLQRLQRLGSTLPREQVIGLLAMAILNEIVDIAEAAKMDIQPQDAAGAFKDMLLRYLGENGVDTSQLQQGMDQIDPAVFSQAAA
jgi:hypothetical protein